MSGFVLPPTSIPSWAQNMSDEEFQTFVRNQIPTNSESNVER